MTRHDSECKMHYFTRGNFFKPQNCLGTPGGPKIERGGARVGGRAQPLNPPASPRRNREKENQRKRKIYGVSKSTFCEICKNTMLFTTFNPKSRKNPCAWGGRGGRVGGMDKRLPKLSKTLLRKQWKFTKNAYRLFIQFWCQMQAHDPLLEPPLSLPNCLLKRFGSRHSYLDLK